MQSSRQGPAHAGDPLNVVSLNSSHPLQRLLKVLWRTDRLGNSRSGRLPPTELGAGRSPVRSYSWNNHRNCRRRRNSLFAPGN